MANKDSTAVNELINLVNAGHQRVRDVDDDIMFRPPTPKPPAQTIRAHMAPLPRRPSGTQSLPAVPQIPTGPASHQVRVTTAPVSRTASIPPLPQEAFNGRATNQSLPPPPHKRAPAPAPEGTPSPEIFSRNGLASTMTGPAVAIARANALPLPSPSLTPIPMAAPMPPRMPVAAPFEAPIQHESVEELAPMLEPQPEQVESSWFQSSRMVEKVDESWNGPTPIGRIEAPISQATIWKKLVWPVAGAAVIAFFAIGYVAFDGETPTRTAAAATTPAKKAEPAPAQMQAKTQPAVVETAKAPAPVADPAATDTTRTEPPPAAAPPAPEPPKAEPPKTEPVAQPAVATSQPAKAETPAPPTPVAANLIDVRFDSTPAGATVMLVDHGKSMFLGTTPVNAAIDPSRKYDVVFTLENRPTVLQHLDPAATHHLAVALGKTAAQPAVAKTEPAHQETHHHTAQPAVAKTEAAKKLATPTFDEPKAEPNPEPHVAKEAPKAETPTGDGSLMVSSKPPCSILIDGRATGLTTPQRAIPLPPGTHKITFVNKDQNINKTVTVNVTSGTPTKLIQNLMQAD